MIRLGFIGAGGYGRVQIDGFLILQAQELVKITALADPSPAILKALIELPELKGARCFLDYWDLLAMRELDAVVICAPIPFHEEMTLAALARDLFILLEKPPVPLLSQLERLIAADANGRVMVAFQHIYSDLIGNLKQELVAGRIGQILSISAQGIWPRLTAYYRRSAWAGQLAWRGQAVLDGPCTNAFAHYINLVLYLAGDKEDLFAMPVQLAGEAYRARPDFPTYDTGCLTGSLESDVRFFIGFSHAASDLCPVEIRIWGTDGELCLMEATETSQSGGIRLIRWDEGRETLRRAFIAFASGDASKNKTPLCAMKAYLLATNLMLFPSGGIHQISDEHVHSLAAGTENGVFAVEKIDAFLAQSARQIAPLCQTPEPWAQKTPSLLASSFSEAELIQTLRLFASVNA
jgi:predicted dehydrogenase